MANNMSQDFNLFLPLSKVERQKDGSVVVSGYASTPSLDLDDEIVSLDAVRKALPGYWSWRNIREMHQPSAVGVAKEANVDDKGLFLTARITDPTAAQKCIDQVYKGYSIGGRKLAKDGNTITEIELVEISIVDRPANPDCRISVSKRAKDGKEAYLIKDKISKSSSFKALVKMAEAVEILAKDRSPPAAHDGFSLPAEKSNPSLRDDSTQNNKSAGKCKEHDVENCASCMEKGLCEAHGVANCAECKCAAADGVSTEKREFSTAERDSAAASGAALPDGSYPIKNKKDLKNAVTLYRSGHGKDLSAVRAHIVSRAKSLGVANPLSSKDKPKKIKKKLAKMAKREKVVSGGVFSLPTPDFLSLSSPTHAPEFLTPPGYPSRPGVEDYRNSGATEINKRLGSVGSLSFCFDTIRDVQRGLIMEAQREGGDKKDEKLAQSLGKVSQDLASIISLKASHEGEEAADLSDADDDYIRQFINGDGEMDKVLDNEDGNSSLNQAILDVIKRSVMPSKAKRFSMAQSNLKKARKSNRSAMADIKECHAALSKRYMAKLGKAGKKPGDDQDDDMVETEKLLKVLQKAHSALTTTKTFIKAADAQIEKVARSGQRGQETGDGVSGVFEVPPGVKDLSPDAMATAGGGGMPPMYPADGGVYPGKMAKLADKDGKVSLAAAEMLAENARLAGQVETLSRVSGPSARPYNFDVGKVFGGAGSSTSRSQSDVLFQDVDVNLLNHPDENVSKNARATVAGNYLTHGQFGKSILDPSFRGSAGSKRN